MRHNLQLRIAPHDGSHDSYCARAFGKGHLGIGAIGVGYVFYLVAMAGDVDERRMKLHQRVYALIESAHIAPFQWGHQFETGERTMAVCYDVNNFHVLLSGKAL